MKKTTLFALFILLLLLSGCSGAAISDVLQGPTPMPGAAQTPLPEAQVLFTINPPADTPSDAAVSLELVDTVTGLGYHGQQYPMTQLDSGQWEVSLELPLGSLIRYRYLLTQPFQSVEHNLRGQPLEYRVGYIPSAMQLIDQVAAWDSSPSPSAGGRIIGQLVSANDRQPVVEMIISAAGQQTFTDGQGRFRLEALPAGLNNLVAYHPAGAFRPVQQGAIVAEGGTTPANFEAMPAEPVTMTFQVEVPADTPPDPPLRLVGNLSTLGDVFTQLPGGVEISAVRAPEFIQVDDSHYLLLADMYAGTDLRYKYTLGDGLWNAERTEQGAFITRQIIIPETDAIQMDSVASWRKASSPINLTVQAPATTPAGERIGLQFNPFTPFEALPMVDSGESRWQFSLWSPRSFGQSIQVQFCRNLECGRANAIEPQNLPTDGASDIEIEIEGWQWWPEPPTAPTVIAPELTARPGMQLGVDLIPLYQPSWASFDQHVINQVTGLNANSLTLSPAWVAHDSNGTPLISFDPKHDRFQRGWLSLAQRAANQGLSLSVRPELIVAQGDLSQWWRQGARDSAWWTTTYEELSSFLLTQAALAEKMGADRFIINGTQFEPALPGGELFGGEPANQPLTAETYWRQLLDEIRAVFSGQIVFELELSQNLSRQPQFLDAVDAVQIYWHAPLSDDPAAAVEELQQEAGRFLELEVLGALPPDMPVSISAEYLSIEGAAAACPARNAGGCRPTAEFDGGAEVDPEIKVDLLAQSQALNALLLAVNDQEQIEGFSVRRYYPIAAMQDKSASIHGKPGADLLRYWYQGWQGQ